MDNHVHILVPLLMYSQLKFILKQSKDYLFIRLVNSLIEDKAELNDYLQNLDQIHKDTSMGRKLAGIDKRDINVIRAGTRDVPSSSQGSF